MQSPPVPRYLVPPRSKYSTQHHVLKHPQLPLFPQFQRSSFTPIQNNRQNYSSIYLDLYIKCYLYIIHLKVAKSQLLWYCINYLWCSRLHHASVIIKHFIIQLMHNIEHVDTIKNYKIFKSAPTCFVSQRIRQQGALYIAWLKITRMILSCPLTWTRSVLWQLINYSRNMLP